MPGIKVEITRFVAADQPGFVECQFVDSRNRLHSFIEKIPVVTDADLWSDSDYPQHGIIECELLERSADEFGETAVVSTVRPWGVESVNGLTQFVIRSETLVE